MEFEDLSGYDINLIKSLSVGLLTNTKMNCRFDALSESTLGCIYSKGFNLTPYPEKLSIVISNSLRSRGHNRQWPADEVIKEVFLIIKELEITIIKDEGRTPMWTNPKPSWYTSYTNHKKTWMW